MLFSLKTKIMLSVLAVSFLTNVVVSSISIKRSHTIIEQKRELEKLKEKQHNLEEQAKLHIKMLDSYKEISEEQERKLKENEEEFKHYRDTLNKALTLNPRWSNEPIPDDIAKVLNSRVVIIQPNESVKK